MNLDALHARELRILDQAKEETKRNDDGSFVEDSLIANIKKRLFFDAEREHTNKAKRLLARAKRPGHTPKTGQLILPGFNDSWGFEPDRMVSDETGNVIENDRVLPRFKAAATTRSSDNLDLVFEQHRRLEAENKVFQAWALEQALAGRKLEELTWGNCVREKGYLKPDSAAA